MTSIVRRLIEAAREAEKLNNALRQKAFVNAFEFGLSRIAALWHDPNNYPFYDSDAIYEALRYIRQQPGNREFDVALVGSIDSELQYGMGERLLDIELPKANMLTNLEACSEIAELYRFPIKGGSLYVIHTDDEGAQYRLVFVHKENR